MQETVDAIRDWKETRGGPPLPFDRSRIFPYGFRRTFCQRDADAEIGLHTKERDTA